MPRPKLPGGTVEWTITLPKPLAAQVNKLLHDPITGKPVYGGRAALITRLLQTHVNEQFANRSDGTQLEAL